MDRRAGGRAGRRDSDERPEPSRRFGRRTNIVVTVVAVAVVSLVVLAVGTALAATAPPAPVISKGPTGATAARTATFTYRDSVTTVTFLCALDAAKLKACSAKGTTYKALAPGNHTFKVAAKAKSGAVSRTTSRAWTIDTAAPTMKLTYPVNGAVYSAAAWAAGCTAGVGVCGTAADPARRRVRSRRRTAGFDTEVLDGHRVHVDSRSDARCGGHDELAHAAPAAGR